MAKRWKAYPMWEAAVRSLRYWLTPGLGVKRWLVVLLLGITELALALAYVLVTIYREQPLPSIFYYLTLQFIPRLGRAVLFGLLGFMTAGFALWQLNRTLLSPFVQPGRDVAEILRRHRQRERGPRIVVIGGGTGQSTLLRGLKAMSARLTAVVTVADDGGSSGRLRREMGLLPPGDFRNCLAALAEAEPLMTALFQYRFGRGTGLNGHAFGNLFIAAMAEITGSFERAVAESSRVLAVRGRVLPCTVEQVMLAAEIRDAEGRIHRVDGESAIPEVRGRIERVWLIPEHARAYPETIRAILEADLIVLGPGSLYTSVLPNLLVEGIVPAIRASRALKVYVCNVATQIGETEGYSVGEHVQAIERHVGPGLFELVLVNSRTDVLWTEIPGEVGDLVRWDGRPIPPYTVVAMDVIDERMPWRHDPEKLARALMALFEQYRH
ncbi:uridine diphosphate-N-acetylglucosamine-binding protein YvcK [Thermoflexus sp.]|uniref:gluconeogenesis factor YvcK family protein n=1 Tax=Thermoflexus sp. TaxID=1969742 RepID=UPI0035E41930